MTNGETTKDETVKTRAANHRLKEVKKLKTLGWFYVITAFFALYAAFALTLEKIHVLNDKDFVPSCNVGVLVKCSTNLASSQGSIFGFPNPLIGLVCWPIVIVIGVALISRVKFPRWYWLSFNLGVLGALVFVIWLITQSIFELDVLCPWCMLTWAITIPTFAVTTLHNLRAGHFSTNSTAKRIGAVLYRYIPVITLAGYLIVVIIAQIQMNAIPRVILDLQNFFR